MPRYSGSLPPTKINPDHHQALQQLADKLQTSASQLTRQAIAEFLAKHGFKPSSTSATDRTRAILTGSSPASIKTDMFS